MTDQTATPITAYWLMGLGFQIHREGSVTLAAIPIESHGGEDGRMFQVFLDLMNMRGCREWLTYVSRVDKGEETALIHLAKSTCNTQDDLLRLCAALGVEATT